MGRGPPAACVGSPNQRTTGAAVAIVAAVAAACYRREHDGRRNRLDPIGPGAWSHGRERAGGGRPLHRGSAGSARRARLWRYGMRGHGSRQELGATGAGRAPGAGRTGTRARCTFPSGVSGWSAAKAQRGARGAAANRLAGEAGQQFAQNTRARGLTRLRLRVPRPRGDRPADARADREADRPQARRSLIALKAPPRRRSSCG